MPQITVAQGHRVSVRGIPASNGRWLGPVETLPKRWAEGTDPSRIGRRPDGDLNPHG